MTGNHTLLTLHIPGTLAADVNFRWAVPFDCHVGHVSAVASNDSDATLTLGTAGDTDGILAEQLVGDSDSPAEYSADNFAANAYGRLARGDTLVLAVDHDGEAGTAAQNLSVVITLTEG